MLEVRRHFWGIFVFSCMRKLKCGKFINNSLKYMLLKRSLKIFSKLQYIYGFDLQIRTDLL